MAQVPLIDVTAHAKNIIDVATIDAAPDSRVKDHCDSKNR